MGFIAGFFGVIAVICGIVALLCHLGVKSYEKEERREQEAQELKRLETMYRELEAGTWKFPVYELEEELENLGIKYPVDDAAVSGANQVILGILNRYGVPHQYHGRYLGKEQINGYFLELERLEREQVIAAIQKHAIRNGATSITTEAGYQKARVIMENVLEESDIPDERRSKYMEREQIESCFTEVSIRLQQIQERKRQTRLEKKRKEEAALAKEYAKETRYIGREKTVRYCKAQVAAFKKEIQACKDELDGKIEETAERSMQYDQVDNNWAIHGGVASAIAGPVVGAVMAADAKERIDQRNQKNAELASLNMQLFMLNAQEIKSRHAKAEQELRYWNKKLEAAKYALEEWQDENELLKQIKPSVKSCRVSETGAVKLTVRFHSTPDLLVFGEKHGFVDGSLLVTFKDGDKVCGTAICCLPFLGSTHEGTAECICTKTTDPDKKDQVEFAPNKLWAMEKL